MSVFRRLGGNRTPSSEIKKPNARGRLELELLEDRSLMSVNPIIAENLLPGNPQSEWDVIGAGDTTIQGFSTDISVDQGQTVYFKINDPSGAPYHIDIYRMGYYGGLGGRKVGTIPSSQTLRVNQPAPLKNNATGLVDAGNWSVTASWAVPSTAVSGIYVAKLVREDTGGASHIIFVVRDDDGQSDVMFQTSDTTWQAYNNWGGESMYDPSSTDGTRAYAVSYNRPLTVRGIPGGLGESNGPFWAEIPMVRWLEANGYNVSYTTDVDSDRRGSEILEHKVFLSVGHDEYWSGQQRANVEAARDAGVNMAFLTGNEVYWKVRWETSIDSSGTPYRTMVCYKESAIRSTPLPQLPSEVQLAYPVTVEDPSSEWTGLWRDLRFASDAKVEQLLTGQLFSVNRGANNMFGTSIQVPSAYSQMRLWRNTTIAGLQSGQVATLAAGTLGYEWDEDVDTIYRPAGMINMSSTTEAVPEKLVDPISWPGCGGLPSALCGSCRGCAVAPGTATHNLTLYRADSGALVFGAGTVQWSWGLDGVHDGGASFPDIRMEQATVNLFADMGVTAGTLKSGLIQTTMSTDLARPTSTITSPSASSNFLAGVPVTITGTSSDTGGGVIGGVEVSFDGGQTWRKATGRENWSYVWTPDATGPVTLLSRAADDSCNTEIPSAGVQVTVSNAPSSTTGLVAAYNFNAGSGTVLADSAGSNNGIISNAVWSSGGMFGSNALSFNGSNALVTIADHNSLDLTNAMTLEAWVKPTSNADYRTAIIKEKAGGDVYSLYATTGAGKPPGAFVVTSAHHATGGSSQLPLNVWSHLAATYDGTTLSLYVNGNLVQSEYVSGSIQTSTGALRIGGSSVYGDYFAGLIDEVRVYNRALNVGEIRSDMTTPIGGTPETTNPTGSITNSAGTVSGNVTLTATASDNTAVAGVQFRVNGQPVGPEDLTAPYSFVWNTSLLSNGVYSITARIRDVAGNTIITSPVNLTVNNSPETTAPQLAMTNITPGGTVGGTVILSAVSTDNVGVVGVQFKANGVNIGAEVTTAPYRVLWHTSNLTSGNYTITAVSRDAAGNTTTTNGILVTVDSTAPTITAQTPAPGATNVPTDTNPTVTFSEWIDPSSLSFVLKDSAGNPRAGTVVYDSATKKATLNLAASLATSETYTLTVSGVKDLVGNQMSGPVSWTFTVSSYITGASIWGDGVIPTNPSALNDSSAIEVGMKFRTLVAGNVLGMQFYKGPGNTGTHVGHLWTANGTLLATATFSNESASGWQHVDFSSPVALSANTTYVVSYYAPNGHYAFDSNYFASSGINSYPLRALANNEDGGNGLFTYQSGGGFPTNTYNAANYWVDVTFSTNTTDTTPPAVVSRNPASSSTGVPVNGTVTATFSEPIQASTLSFVLKDSAGNTVPSTVTYNDVTWTATLTPTSALNNSASYTATISGAKDTLGNTMPSATSWSFSTAAPQSGSSIWSSSSIPNVPAALNDSSAIEVGTKFRSTQDGYITGMQFYKGPGNTGTHVGHLWTAGGTLLATATFTNETTTGWQYVNFSSPVPISANTTYVVSYYAPNGRYSFDSGYFASNGVTNGSLRALANGEDGGNGLFTYASGGGFPNGSYQSANYWVDVTFATSASDTSPPGLTAQTPANGATGVPLNSTVTATFSEPVQASSISFVLRDSFNAVVPSTMSYNSSTQTVTLTPNASLVNNMTYTATVTASDNAGNQMPATSWSFQSPTPSTNASLFPSSVTPTILTENDTNPIELGVRFFSEVNGYISGLRFYKGPGATGTHVGSLWTNDGTLLATATFTNESSSGWQQVNFSSPVAISANTLYVASYYAPQGRYSATPAYFTTDTVNGYLHAPADGANGGNGLYRYINGGGFPNNTYNSNNYFVDVVFSQNTSDSTAPTVASRTPANGAIGIMPTSPIGITFSEAVQVPTISIVVKDAFNATVTGNLNYDPATHTASFIPTSPLLPFMTYTVTVSGVKDLSGNTMVGSSTATFKTKGIWVQTTYSDFTAGNNDGTFVTNNSNGELQLAPELAETFDGSSLNTSNWNSKSWTPDGGGAQSMSFSDGIMSIGATALLSAQAQSEAAVLGSINFAAAPYQHFGLATSFDSAIGNYWALFSTWGSTNNLYARVNANGSTTDVYLGNLPTGFHLYKIAPTSSGFDFFIDGALVTSISASFQNSVALRAGVSAFNGGSSPALQADWIRFDIYSPSRTGIFTSTTYDAGEEVNWDETTWNADVPQGTTLTVETSSSVDGVNWSNWAAAINSVIASPNGRYLRYRVIMTTDDAAKTPVLYDISFTWF